jgi:formylglycine-generating enzyme required for sulfatase activity
MRVLTSLGLICAAGLTGFGSLTLAADDTAMVTIGPAEFESAVPPSTTEKIAHIPKFELDVVPVSNAQFLKFVQQHPQWQRGRAGKLFADAGYLTHWGTADELLDADQAKQPAVRVSWFAAGAYCEARGARLPRWYEWELAAAAGTGKADARKDPEWRQQMLSWYSRPSSARLPNIGSSPANYYGVKDLHGLIWEWVEDYNAMLVGVDNREQGGADLLQFCGAGAISMEQKENYAVLMRVALLSSLEARYTTRNLGFRCARDLVETQK